MPAFTTHYLFGVKAYHHLKPGPLRHSISRYHGVYSFGEQGPDPFFFSPLSYLRKAGNPADYMHEDNLGSLILAMADRVAALPEGKKKQCLLAYTAGFIGHYELDSAMHPYVYGRTDPALNRKSEQYGEHFFLENDLDVALLSREKGMDLNDFEMHRVILMGRKESRWIADFLKDASEEVYPDMKPYYLLMRFAVSMEWLFSILLQDRHKVKMKWAERLERRIFGHVFYTGLIASKNPAPSMEDPFNFRHEVWRNPWDPEKERRESVPELMRNALKRYINDLRALEEHCCRQETAADKDITEVKTEKKTVSAGSRSYRRLKFHLGNRSLHSGFDYGKNQ